jgi:hypothetical protein
MMLNHTFANGSSVSQENATAMPWEPAECQQYRIPLDNGNVIGKRSQIIKCDFKKNYNK